MSIPKTKIEINSLEKILQSEKRAQYSTYRRETESALSHLCEAGDALGPLVLKQQIGLKQWILTGDVFYSRFRPGDRVELRTQKTNTDQSVKFSDDWKIDQISYPALGKIQILISGEKPLMADGVLEVFLFKSSSTRFTNLLINKLNTLSKSDQPKILGNDHFTLSTQDSQFKKLHDNLNETQKFAMNYLIENNLSGAIQGPPGTGKTQLLQTVINLALSSNMKVCVTSLTNAAVDNLIGRIVSDDFQYDWARVGNSEKVKRELYPKVQEDSNFVSQNFKKEVNESQLIGSTLHKLVYNKTAPKFDLLVIDEAGQVPIYFWPFIERLAKRVVLVGDQFQLPPVYEAKQAILPFDNIFTLVINNETPMLETQYRMRREIQAWSSEKFYKGKLVPHSSVANRDFFDGHFGLFPDNCMEYRKFDSLSSGKSSQNEADFITNKIERIFKDNISLNHVGVICPYRAQAGLVNSALQHRLGVQQASKVLVDTVERFQGQEKEALFLSLGSSGANQEELRFLSDPKRLNVSITRAKSRFYCLFDAQLWERSGEGQSEDLNEFLRWMTYGKIIIKHAA